MKYPFMMFATSNDKPLYSQSELRQALQDGVTVFVPRAAEVALEDMARMMEEGLCRETTQHLCGDFRSFRNVSVESKPREFDPALYNTEGLDRSKLAEQMLHQASADHLRKAVSVQAASARFFNAIDTGVKNYWGSAMPTLVELLEHELVQMMAYGYDVGRLAERKKQEKQRRVENTAAFDQHHQTDNPGASAFPGAGLCGSQVDSFEKKGRVELMPDGRLMRDGIPLQAGDLKEGEVVKIYLTPEGRRKAQKKGK